MIVTGYQCVSEEGHPVPCDAFGNNVAFKCPNCGHPVLAIILPHQRGSHDNNAAECRDCRRLWWVSAETEMEQLRIHALGSRAEG